MCHNSAMKYFGTFYLDREKDMIVTLQEEKGHLYYEIETPNHATGNLIRNLARLTHLPLTMNAEGLQVIRGKVPCYIDGNNQEIFIFRLGNTKTANIYPDGRIEMKASIPAISKTLMSQTKDYRLDEAKTIFKTYIRKECKFMTDLHTHMNGNLNPDVLIALGIVHEIRYPYYYVKKLGLTLTDSQKTGLEKRRQEVAPSFQNSGLQGKYLNRKIDDNTFINFADLILNGVNTEENIRRIRNSLVVMKDGQAVFTNLEKVYLYRYVFTKGKADNNRIPLENLQNISDPDILECVRQMQKDHETDPYRNNTLFQDKLLWIARMYESQGIRYVEISDTTLVKRKESVEMLEQVHAIMPSIYKETGVRIRFLAAMRRIPLTIVQSVKTPADYLQENLNVLAGTILDPYVAGCDFVGEEINDIIELKPVFPRLLEIAQKDPDFTIRIHAGENDSLKENMAHSISCVTGSMKPGMKMPQIRLGHGLYSYPLSSKKGKQLLKDLKDCHVVLEFQITSNVRLNNLNRLSHHPLRQYLENGVACVQGTDGAALYGTTCMDEQLSLEKLLGLSVQEMMQMKQTEETIVERAEKAFARKEKEMEVLCQEKSLKEVLTSSMEKKTDSIPLIPVQVEDTTQYFAEKIHELPWDRLPIIVAGGSFNSSERTTRISETVKRQLDELMERLDPSRVFFVIGHRMQGYERYICDHNRKGFEIWAIVPTVLDHRTCSEIEKRNVNIRVSTESKGMGIYKSFNYEIFERRHSVVIALDGNSAGENLIQEAHNGKGKAWILVYERARTMRLKAESLEGYVSFFDEHHPLASMWNLISFVKEDSL